METDGESLEQATTARGRRLQQAVPPERWRRLVQDAVARAAILERIWRGQRASGESMRKSVEQVAPEIGWSAYQRWKGKYDANEGPAWERLLDERLPPPPRSIDGDVRAAACLLRRADRSIGPEAAQGLLSEQFGQRGEVSRATLKRIWAAAELSWEPPKDRAGRVPGEEVEQFTGGGGLALLGAAELELGSSAKLAEAVADAGRQQADSQEVVEPLPEQYGERDDQGRFTAAYNGQWRAAVEPGDKDERWAPDDVKGSRVSLGQLQIPDLLTWAWSEVSGFRR